MLHTIAYRRILDLSYPIDPTLPQWRGDPLVEFEATATIASDGYYLRRFAMGEHSATHMNAPNSFFDGEMSISDYSTESLVVTAVVIDIEKLVLQNEDYLLTLADVKHWEQHYGPVPTGAIVLLFTGWQMKWSEPTAFLNYDAQGVPHFPGFSPEAVQFLLDHRAIAGVGIDTHGVDGGQDSHFRVNRLVLANHGLVLENLTQLDQLPPTGTTIAIGRLKLQGGSGSPASVLAFIP